KRKGNKNGNYGKVGQGAKKVINLDTNEIFDSISAAARQQNVNVASILYACQGKTKTCKGFHWQYYKEQGT
ncbi:MAG: hypothetical protein LBF97_06550, partial [Elusimicrobiota bacterium]|nr:hypothetical protein [Elusimicrobiota bacterium]